MATRLPLALLLIGALFAASAAEARAVSFNVDSYREFEDDTPFAHSPLPGLGLGYLILEDFEDGLLNAPGVTASRGSVVGPGIFTDSIDADDGSVDGLGQAGHSYSVQGENVDFFFDADVLGALPTHVAIAWTDVGNRPANGEAVSVFAFNASDAIVESIVGITVGEGLNTGQTGEDHLFGFERPEGIARIRIKSDTGSTDWEVDHLQFGGPGAGPAVPEPTSLALVGLGAAALASRRRRGAAVRR